MHLKCLHWQVQVSLCVPCFTQHTLCYSSRSISLYEVAALFTLKVTIVHVRAKIYALKAM